VVAIVPVLRKTTAAIEPANGALDDPALRFNDEAVGIAVTVLHVCGSDERVQRQTQLIDQNVTFLALDRLTGLKAMGIALRVVCEMSGTGRSRGQPNRLHRMREVVNGVM
jgi:hypothetical protein